MYEQTFLREHDNLGIVNSTYQLALRRCRAATHSRVSLIPRNAQRPG